jgi:hypothetical protein
MISIQIPEAVDAQYLIEDKRTSEKLLAILKSPSTSFKTKENHFLGLFSDVPDLIDEITDNAMRDRINNPLRTPY